VLRLRSGAWTNITPTGTARPWKLPPTTRSRPGRCYVQADGGYERISTDYGTTWAAPNHTFTSPSNDVAWLAASNGGSLAPTFFTTIGGLQFDPVVPDRVWMSQGIGVWYADLPATITNPVPWTAQSRGIEQIVVNDVTVPSRWPPGRHLLGPADHAPGETTGGGTYPYQYHPDNGSCQAAGTPTTPQTTPRGSPPRCGTAQGSPLPIPGTPPTVA
jgi:hypothetical protein